MEKLENMLKNVFKKHPVISTIVAVKAVDLAIAGAAYYIINLK